MLTDNFLSDIKPEIMCDSNIESIDGNSMIPIELGGTLKYGTKQTVSVSDLGRQLLLAARNGETVQVHELMSRGAPFTTDWLGTSPLHLAAMNNHLETCEVLIRAGIGKDARTKVDRTPLHFAVYEGHVQITELFLNNKCEVDARDMLKMTALHWAIEKKNKRIIELLLQFGADPTVVTKFDKTPLSIAMETGQTDVVEMLEMASRIKMENSSQVQEATDSILYELQKDLNKDGNTHLSMDTDSEEKDNLNMDSLSSDVHINSENDTATNDSSNIIEYDSSTTLSEAIIQLQNIDETKPLDTNTLQMLKSHGISFLPQDDTDSFITSALQHGRKLVLTENGKLLLNGVTKSGSGNNSININEAKLIGESTKNGQYLTQSTPPTIHSRSPSINDLDITNPIISNFQQTNNTLKLIKKSTFNHNQSNTSAKNGNLKTNRVIKILSAEEFKQICRGDVTNAIKKLNTTIHNNNSNNGNIFSNLVGNNDIQISTPSPSVASTIIGQCTNSSNNSIKVQTIKSPNILTGSSVVVNNNINSNNNNNNLNNNKQTQRRIVVNKNKFNAITAGIKMPIYNEVKTPNKDAISNNQQINHHMPITNSNNETIYTLVTTSNGITVPIIHHPQQQQHKSINNSNLGKSIYNNNNNLHDSNNSSNNINNNSNNNDDKFVTSNICITEVERQLLELKKQTDELRKQLELSQKQTEEYKVRLEKLEKERDIEKEERKRIKL